MPDFKDDRELETATDRPLIEPVTAAYVHVPFCVRKCGYCDFTSYAGSLPRLPDYIETLVKEIKSTPVPSRQTPLETVYLGGGTPSLLRPGQVERLLDTLSDRFGLDREAEVTIEANPGTVQPDQLRDYVKAGVNRISIGVQTTEPRLLKLLGRIHQPQEAVDAILAAHAAGFKRISADLMFGLPEQTVADVERTARTILALPVSHLSFYSLSIEEGTPFHAAYGRHPERLPDEETERAQYDRLLTKAAQAGLVHYEISNAAKSGDESRHNLVYWQARPYYGFGAGAHSYVAGVRRGNAQSLDDYGFRVKSGLGPFAAAISGQALTRQEQEQEFMLLGLRLIAGVEADSFQRRFGIRLDQRFQAEIRSTIDRGLLEKTATGYRLTRRGLDLANQVFMEFV